jgi:hypothetical protein
MLDIYRASLEKLRRFCEAEDFKGYDPYDGLNSRFAQLYPIKNSRLLRLIWIQTFKKSVINMRPLFLIKKGYNPKGIALFLTGYCNLYRLSEEPEYLEKVNYLAKKLIALQSPGFSGACWGYNFPWQSRSGFLPKGTPTVVATSFAADALMNAFECTQRSQYLDTALSSCRFILKDLVKSRCGDGFLFSYTPKIPGKVYNASLLASRLLARAYTYGKDAELADNARASVLACTQAQRADGAWVYGELPYQNWVDSFHTGYNLECISEYQRYIEDRTFAKSLESGLQYYLGNFFLDDGTPKYYDDGIYPVDIHAPAQFIVTLAKMSRWGDYKDMADKVMGWTIEKMQDRRRGYFYYQLKQRVPIRTIYMRWGQAWMFYALSFQVLEASNSVQR